MKSFSHKSESRATTTIYPDKQQNQSPPSLLTPYGSIPKYKKDKKRKKVISTQKQDHYQEPSALTPYPFFRLTLKSRPSFLTSLAHKWYINPLFIKKNNTSAPSSKNEKSSPVGFMPRALPTTASSSTSTLLDDTTWSFSSIDVGEKCDSGTLAKGTQYSPSSHYHKTASTLSGILCENYVQSQLMIMTMMEDDASEDADVENDADGCPVTCPSLTPTSTSSTSTSSTSSSISPAEPFLLDTLIYPSSCTFDNKIFDTTTPSYPSIPSSPSSNNYNSTNRTAPINVPLSTFRMFRARDDEDDHYYNQDISTTWNDNDHDSDDTTTNEARFGSYDDDPFYLQQHDEKKKQANSTISTNSNHLNDSCPPHNQGNIIYSGKEALLENSWANWEKAWQGKEWIISMSEQEEKKDDCLPRSSSSSSPITNEQQQQQQHDQSAPIQLSPTSLPSPTLVTPIIKSREPRVNSAHLRMLVIEVNMMRADKIVGPLRPRNYLPKRTDPLPYPTHPLSPSPLSLYCLSSETFSL